MRFKLNLVTQILVAFVLAVILGVIFGESVEVIEPLGDLFLRLIKFIIAPLILATLVIGISSSGDPKQLGRMGLKTVVYYLLTTALAIIFGLAVAFAFSPGKALDTSVGDAEMVEEAAEQSPPGTIETLLNIVPENPFHALAEANILQIIFFALFIGIAITLVGEKAQPVYRFFDGLAEIMYKITEIIMKFAPIGILGLVAPIVGDHGLTVLIPLTKVILAVFVACVLHAIIVYSTAVRLYGKLHPLTFFKGISPAAIVAFSTASSAGTLPVTIKNTQNLGVPNKIGSFVLPLGATINMDGTAIYQGVSVVFIAQYYDLNLTFVQLLTVVLTTVLASIGTAGVPGAGLIMLTMVLTSIGLPLKGIALIAGIDRILDMLRTCINVVGDASASVVVAGSEKELNSKK